MTTGRRGPEPHTPDEVSAETLEPSVTRSAPPVEAAAVVPRAGLGRAVPWIVAGCGAAVAVLTLAVVREQPAVIDVDLALHGWALAHRGPVDLALALTVTWAGATYVALPALVVIGAVAPPGRRPLRIRLGSGLLLAGAASVGVYAGLLLNHLVGRARPPYEDWWGAAGGPAFPSGHTTMATVLGVLGAWALLERAPHRRRALVAAAVATAAAVGLSRVWLGVHWPSDVVGGWLFGTAWALGCVLLLGRRRRPSAGD
jgi:membrane-associated phospholipid phosphatase